MSALKGVLLAYERNKKESFWGPYLASLPPQPSAGWYLKPAEAAQTLQKLGNRYCAHAPAKMSLCALQVCQSMAVYAEVWFCTQLP